jgi:LPS-assembly lipoprotein
MTRLSAIGTVAATLALGGCGFHPLYGTIGSSPGAQVMFGSIYVPPIELENAGYELRNDLADLMQAKVRPDATTLYELHVTLAEHRQPIAIQNVVVPVNPQATCTQASSESSQCLKEVDITRYNYLLVANYQLVDRKTQKVLTKGTENSLSAYDVVASPYATLVAQQDVQARTAQDIAQHLRIRLGIYFAQQASAQR